MLARVRGRDGVALPAGWLDLARQLFLIAVAYYAYRLVRGLVDGRATAAFQHARVVIGAERGMHAFVEPSVQAWATSKTWLIDLASWMYVNCHFVLTLSAFVFIYVAHNRSFYFVRNMFLVAMGIALVGYAIYPTAPPRMMPEWGFTDSVSNFTGVSQNDVTVNALFNPFAAIPSMHVAFALLVGGSLARLVRHRALKLLWLVYPLVMTFVVVATGNHFLLDAVFGALTAGASVWIADHMLARARPAAWAFDQPPRVTVPA